MKTSLTRIGNSKGVILPASLLKQCGFEDDVEINIQSNQIIISPSQKPREGWLDSIRAESPDELQIGEMTNDFDDDSWTW